MHINKTVIAAIMLIGISCDGKQDSQKVSAESAPVETKERFNRDKDLLLAHFDCKTDVDDLHSVAALVTMMSHPDFSDIKYHAVAGAYGVQEGLYVPPNDLFQLALGDNWSDAHTNWESAVQKVRDLALPILDSGGNIWIADGGQSDFSADLISTIKQSRPGIATKQLIHVVQHSDWNEEVTSAEAINTIKESAEYIRIPDGNAVGNGTPGFRTPGYTLWKEQLQNQQLLQVWQLAVDLGLKYNAAEGRYNNEAVADQGLDFSDLSETCWILGLEDINDTAEFFERFGR